MLKPRDISNTRPDAVVTDTVARATSSFSLRILQFDLCLLKWRFSVDRNMDIIIDAFGIRFFLIFPSWRCGRGY